MHIFLAHINILGGDLGLGYDAVYFGQPEAHSPFVTHYLFLDIMEKKMTFTSQERAEEKNKHTALCGKFLKAFTHLTSIPSARNW